MILPNRNWTKKLAHQRCKAFQKQYNTLCVWQEHFLSRSVCYGKVTRDLIILKHCAGWTTKEDPILWPCADQTVGQEANMDVYKHTFLHWQWLALAGEASVGLLKNLLRRKRHNTRNVPALCGLCTFRIFSFFFDWPCAKIFHTSREV